MKSKTIAYTLWVIGFFGCMGIHRLYLDKVGTGAIWFFTWGLCGIGSLYDFVTLSAQVDAYNNAETSEQIDNSYFASGYDETSFQAQF